MSSPETYSDWLARLNSDRFGRMWFRKFQYDIKHGNVPADLKVTLSAMIEDKLNSRAPGDPPLELIACIVLENPASFDLRGLRVPHAHEPYSLIVKLEVFSYYYLKRRSLITILDESDDELEFIWANIGGIITSRFFKGRLRTDRNFFWCTSTEAVEGVVGLHSPDEAATTLRDRLGLRHMDKGLRLIRLDIPAGALAGKKLCAPTTLDSGVNPAFIPFDGTDGYGRTLNLKTITRDIKEVVVEEIVFDETFAAARIGQVSADVPPIPWDDVETLVS